MLAPLPLFERRSRQRAAILIISDGADTASDASVRDVKSALLRSDAFAYAIAIDPPDALPINRRVNPYALREITDDSGGRTEVVHDSADLEAATARIADELNHQYVLAYTSARAPDGQYHSIRVRVTRPDHRVRARRGTWPRGEAGMTRDRLTRVGRMVHGEMSRPVGTRITRIALGVHPSTHDFTSSYRRSPRPST